MSTFSLDSLFGPIGSEYCLYFYILSVIGLLFFSIVIIGALFTGLSKKLGFSFYAAAFLYSVTFLMAYLQNRLLYNMCGNSI